MDCVAISRCLVSHAYFICRYVLIALHIYIYIYSDIYECMYTCMHAFTAKLSCIKGAVYTHAKIHVNNSHLLQLLCFCELYIHVNLIYLIMHKCTLLHDRQYSVQLSNAIKCAFHKHTHTSTHTHTHTLQSKKSLLLLSNMKTSLRTDNVLLSLSGEGIKVFTLLPHWTTLASWLIR